MWFPDPGLLHAHGGSSAFLLLSWQELFDPSTPDPYQPRLLHVAALVDEIRDIAHRAVTDQRWSKHVEMLREEIKSAAHEEKDFLAHLPYYAWSIRHITELREVGEIESTAATLSEQNDALDRHACHELKRAVRRLPKEKKLASSALRRIATLALRAQQTPSDMIGLATSAHLAWEPHAVAEMFIGSVPHREQNYECYLAVKGRLQDLQAIIRETPTRKTGFRLVNRKEAPLNGNASAFFGTNKDVHEQDVGFVVCKTQGFSPASAARTAVQRLRPIVDIFNLYENATSLTILDDVLVRDHARSQTIDLRDTSLHKLKPRNNARRLTLSILERVSTERLDGRILNALEHYSLAHSSAATRVRFVNMWSALECLVGSTSEGSIISSVCNSVAPIIAWRQVDRLVRYFAICLQKFREEQGRRKGTRSKHLGDGFPKGNENHIAPENVLLVLSRPKCHPHIMALLAYIEEHPLLCNRAYRLWETFHDPMQLGKELSSSFDRVRWNLYRSYRARNLIVHQGEEVPWLGHLLETLHLYFSLTLSRILHDMRRHPSWSIQESTVHWRMRWNYLSEQLRSAPRSLVLGDFLPEPIQVPRATHVWTI